MKHRSGIEGDEGDGAVEGVVAVGVEEVGLQRLDGGDR